MDETIKQAQTEAEAALAILKAVEGLDREKALRVIRAAAILHGIEIPWPPAGGRS